MVARVKDTVRGISFLSRLHLLCCGCWQLLGIEWQHCALIHKVRPSSAALQEQNMHQVELDAELVHFKVSDDAKATSSCSRNYLGQSRALEGRGCAADCPLTSLSPNPIDVKIAWRIFSTRVHVMYSTLTGVYLGCTQSICDFGAAEDTSETIKLGNVQASQPDGVNFSCTGSHGAPSAI